MHMPRKLSDSVRINIQTLVIAFLFLIVCLTWGTTWIGIKLAIESIPPIFASGLRFLVAFPLLLLIANLFHSPLTFPKGQFGLFTTITILYFSLPYLLINIGEQYVSSGLTALLFSAMPVFIIVFSYFLLSQRTTLVQLSGIIIGIFALAMILIEQEIYFYSDSTFGIFAVLVAAVLHAFCYVLVKKRGAEIDVITFNVLPMGIAGVLLTVTGVVLEDPQFSEFSAASMWAILYLGLVASVLGFLAYFYLLKHMSPIVLSFVFVIFPVVALVISGVIENITYSQKFFFYCTLMLIGFALTKLPLAIVSRWSSLATRDKKP